jgi:NADPH-dependent ferric siderophore reductase
MVRVTLAGPELEGFAVDLPAASVRVLLPTPGTDELVIPAWNGNEFLLPDGRRPTIRTFTPRRVDPSALELDLDVVDHGGGVASTWAATAEPGHPAAVSGPGRGYTVREDARAHLLVGDETAIPALAQVLAALPAEADVQVPVEVAAPEGRTALADHPRARVTWCDLPAGAPPGAALLDAVRAADLPPDVRVWGAGEAAGVQRIRRHLLEERGLPRSQASIRGYWKHGRAGGDDEDA